MMNPKRVIIIEDDREICQLLEIHLKDLSCEVSAYYDGISGLAAVKASPPDLVILDLMLPGMDGITVCQQIRASNITAPIFNANGQVGRN